MKQKQAPKRITANRVREVLRRYFENHSDGSENKEFDEYFTAQEAIDEIAEIVEEW